MKVLHIIFAMLLTLFCAFLCAHTCQGQPAAGSSVGPTAEKHESPLACNRAALTPEQRKRHFDVLGPALRSLRTGVRELPDGFEFQLPSDQNTFQLATEWAYGERLCCPFFDIQLRLEHEGGPMFLRLTGGNGVKDFIKVEGSAWLKQ